MTKKLIVLDGATSDIGKAIATTLANQGFNLFLLGRDNGKLAALSSKLPCCAGTVAIDFEKPINTEFLVKEVLSHKMNLCGFVHVAGVWHRGEALLYGKKLHEIPDQEFRAVMNVTLDAAITITRALLPHIVTDGSARIVYLTGTFSAGAANWAHYYIAKQALEVLARAVSDEYGKDIPACCVSPADVNTTPLRQFFPDDASTALDASVVAKTIATLFTDFGRNITGQTITVRRRLA